VLLSAAGLVIAVALVRLGPRYDPLGGFTRYALEVFVVVAVGLGALATWWGARSGHTWDADLIPALAGAIGAFTLLAVLHGTPWGPGGLDGDAGFRTEFVTRLADSWTAADYTYRGLPAFYPPAYFWVLGRVADVLELEPWRIIKYGTIVSAVLVPLVSYLLWRVIVPLRTAALISVVPLIVQQFYAGYAWLAIFAIVPWWILAFYRLHRPNVVPPSPILLGVIGGVIFMTYYYYFFVVGLASIVFFAQAARASGTDIRAAVRAPIATLAISALVSAVFWLPLVLSVLSVPNPESLVNRYFSTHDGIPNVPFMGDEAVVAFVSLVGFFYLVLTATTPVSRALLALLGGAIALWLLGFVAALAGFPVVSQRSQVIIPVVLLTGGVLALQHLADVVRPMVAVDQRRRISTAAVLAGVVFAVVAGRSFVIAASDNGLIRRAHTTPLPDGTLPWSAPDDASPETVSADAVRAVINERYVGDVPPVVLSTRIDVLALNTYYGFNQWHIYYAHPASQFRLRTEFLREVARLTDPARFAELTAANRFDAIDAFVLLDTGRAWEFRFRDDNYPEGSTSGTVAFPPGLFDPSDFDIVHLDEYVVIVRRQ
jgi:galactan 5-O-arabinofuranosyltransferase